MPRFFLPLGAVSGGRAVITGADAAHLARSLRARPGERVVVVDPGGVEHGLRLDTVGADECAGTVVWSRPAAAEPRLRVTVLQAVPQQGMDEAIAAMVQAGVHAVVPVVTARTVVRLDPGRGSRRVERWRAVAREAAGLAHRGRVPDVGAVTSLAAALTAVEGRLLAAVPGAPAALRSLTVDAGRPVAVLIGPEGGLDGAELGLVARRGAEPVHLGPRVLRASLAGALATALLLAAAGDLDAGTPPEPSVA